MIVTKKFRVWSHCDDCHFDGLIDYSMIEGEDYDDPESLGVMLLQHCPACETAVNTFIPTDLYQEFLAGSPSPKEEQSL